MKFNVPKFGRNKTESNATPSKEQENYSKEVMDEIGKAIAELKRGGFTYPLTGADKRLLVDDYKSPQNAWYLAANSIESYFLMKDGKIIAKPHLSSSPARVVSPHEVSVVEDDIKKGLQLLYVRPVRHEKSGPPELVTEENEDELDETDEAQMATGHKPVTKKMPTSAKTTTDESSSEDRPGWHEPLPPEKQGRRTMFPY